MTNPTFGGSPAPREVRLSALGEAWAMVQQQMGTWIVTAIIYMAVAIVFNLLQRAVGPKLVDGQMAGSSFMSLILSILSIIVTSIMLGGMYRMALKQLRGQSISPGEIFSATDVAPALIGASLLSGIAIGLGTILCIVPGVIIGALLMLTSPIITDKRVGTMEGLSQSWNALKPNMGSAVVFAIVLGLIILVSLIPCGLGLLVTIPVAILSSAIIYRDFFDNGSLPADNSTLYPPIPNVPM